MMSMSNNDLNKLKLFCTDWGRIGALDKFCEKVVEKGFDGIETGIPSEDSELERVMETLHKYDLLCILQSNVNCNRFDDFLSAYKSELERAARMEPTLINCHTGKDYFAFRDNMQLIKEAELISQSTGVSIVHETHRGRFPYAAHVTNEYLEQLPSLELTLDISHWCVVHESLLEELSDSVNAALHRTSHIHARVGHTQGPQVSDPRAPEWEAQLVQHLTWWDTVIEYRLRKKLPITITTEFGPPNYLPTLPYTQQHLASQWELNNYMLDLLRARYLHYA